jgi:16S rRNA G966 N2-methylase RsmD
VITKQAPEAVIKSLRKGETSIDAEYRKLKRQEEDQRRKDEIAKLAADLPLIDHRWEVVHGDFRDICQEVGDGTVDVIVADPPYSKESLSLYEPLAQAAARVLKPGGSLLLMCGQYYIPDIFQAITPHLRYHWMLAYLTPGGQAPQIWPRQVNAFWKPVLWFTLGNYDRSWIGDVIHSKGNDKRFHEWGQSESGMSALVEKFTRPGDLILDPFVGGGTTGVVAVPLGRRFLGIDCNIQAVEVARRRIAATAKEVLDTQTAKEVPNANE